MSSAHSRNRLTLWYESTRRPRWALAAVVLLLYGPALGGGFFIDDYRSLRLLGALQRGEPQSPYESGRLDPIGLYRFLAGGEGNQADRREGWHPWWLQDDVRYRHFRPTAEWLIRAQHRLFVNHPLGYHAVSLLMYLTGVWLAFALFRRLANDDRLARWAAIIFAVASGHAISVVFLSSQCDLIALILILTLALASLRFFDHGHPLSFTVSLICFLLALGAKEASLPGAVLPLCMAFALRRRDAAGPNQAHRPSPWRRAITLSAVLTLIGATWLAWYAHQGYGANTALMLDPIKSPVDYLTALPGRAIVLLTTWLIPVNPFIFYFRPDTRPWLFVYGLIGAVALLLVLLMFLRNHRGRRDIIAMAVWVLPFLPLLVCTMPDDRVMMLPSVGLAFLGGAWLTRTRTDGSTRLFRLPFVLFIILQITTTWTVISAMRFIEDTAHNAITAAIAPPANSQPPTMIDAPPAGRRCVFVVNAPLALQPLFAQEIARRVTQDPNLRFAYLSDAPEPRMTFTGDRTLRLDAADEPLLASFLGLMGRTQARPYGTGDVFDAGEFTARIVAADATGVQSVDFTFLRPLKHEAYSFYRCDPDGRPRRIQPDALVGR